MDHGWTPEKQFHLQHEQIQRVREKDREREDKSKEEIHPRVGVSEKRMELSEGIIATEKRPRGSGEFSDALWEYSVSKVGGVRAYLQWTEETGSIGCFSGSQILEKLHFKRKKNDYHTDFDSLVLKSNPGGYILNKNLGDFGVSCSESTP